MPQLPDAAVSVLSTWFGPMDSPAYPAAKGDLWFGKSPEVDADLRTRFGATLAQARAGALNEWESTPRGTLALILVLDQFSRNIHRDHAEMYAGDAMAVDLSLKGIEEGTDRKLLPRERVFFYMPLMHAESVALQRMCVRVFERLHEETAGTPIHSGIGNNVEFAIKHRDIVERFGRFPHRNTILGRESSAEERAFLETPGSSF